MLLKVLGKAAILLFIVSVVAVLQSWGNTPASGRLTGIAFMVLLGAAAFWGFRTLFGLPHGRFALSPWPRAASDPAAFIPGGSRSRIFRNQGHGGNRCMPTEWKSPGTLPNPTGWYGSCLAKRPCAATGSHQRMATDKPIA